MEGKEKLPSGLDASADDSFTARDETELTDTEESDMVIDHDLNNAESFEEEILLYGSEKSETENDKASDDMDIEEDQLESKSAEEGKKIVEFKYEETIEAVKADTVTEHHELMKRKETSQFAEEECKHMKNETYENVFKKSGDEKTTSSGQDDATIKQVPLEIVSAQHKRSFDKRLLEKAPPILITEDLLSNPYENLYEGTNLRGKTIDDSDFVPDSLDKWNKIDKVFLKYTTAAKKKCSSFGTAENLEQCTLPSEETVETVSKKTVPSNKSLRFSRFNTKLKAIKDTSSDKKAQSNLSKSNVEKQHMSNKSNDEKNNRGIIFDDYNPITSLPKYFDKIEDVSHNRILKQLEISCIIKNNTYIERKEEASVTISDTNSKEFGKDEDVAKILMSLSDKGSTVSTSKNEAIVFAKPKEEASQVINKLDSLKSSSSGKQPSPSSSNLESSSKIFEMRQNATLEAFTQKEMLPGKSGTASFLLSKDNQNFAKPSTKWLEHEESAVNNLKSTKSRKKSAKRKNKKKSAVQQKQTGESLSQEIILEDNERKDEQVMEEMTSSASENEEDPIPPELYEEFKCLVFGPRKFIAIEDSQSDSSDSIEDLLQCPEFLEELRRVADGTFFM